jgi:very-short-patch-repair endonuclease
VNDEVVGEEVVIPLDRQVVRLDKEGRRRYLDCVWVLPDGRVVVLEVDGSFHAEVRAWWKDMKRERAVVVQGDTVLRCSSMELRLEASDVLADLRAVGVPSRERFVHAS